MNMQGRKTVYEIITERILHFIDENKTLPWRRPWKRYEYEGARPKNVKSKKTYSGINAFLLAMIPYSTPYWGTVRQINELGGRIRKGEKGMPVVYWHRREGGRVGEQKPEDQEGERSWKGSFLRYYTVFNLQQTEGLCYEIPEVAKVPADKQLENVERIIEGYKGRPSIQFGNDVACYHIGLDLVNMPSFEAFEFRADYYHTLLHELIHSTGHSSRLNRDTLVSETKSVGVFAYGKEELIAEMGACFLLAEAGIEESSIDNSASYIQSWKNAISANTKLLIEAGCKAETACRYILAAEGRAE